MLKTNLAVLALVSAAAAAPLSAQTVDADPASHEALDGILAEMPDSETIREVSFYDMSRNGFDEALVTMDRNCDQGYCDWMLFAVGEDGWHAVGAGNGNDVRFEPTEGGGAVLNSDDITWAYSGAGSIYMYGDLLHDFAPAEASDEEYELVASNTKYDQPVHMRLDRYEVDLNGDEVPERVFMINGLFYKAGQWGTPYVIFDANDTLVLEGITSDLPLIFQKSDTPGSIVLNVTPSGFQISEIN
jgi:hypothetical protein